MLPSSNLQCLVACCFKHRPGDSLCQRKCRGLSRRDRKRIRLSPMPSYFRKSQTIFPISRPSLVMCDGHNAHCRRFIPINDRKRESVQNEAACSVLITGPALRPLGQIFKCVVNLGKESDTRLIISLPIPSLGCLHFLPCLWMETVRLTCWHLTAGPPSGGVLLRTESSELCLSRCPRYGV